MKRSIRHQLRQSRAFFFALIAVAIVWIVSSMTEQKCFRETYNIVFDNIDTAKYAIMQEDSALTIDISSNGFNAFRRGVRDNNDIHIDLSSFIRQHVDDSAFSVKLRTEEYLDLIKSQLDMSGVSEVNPVTEHIDISLMLRRRKAFVPDISNVSFNFNKMAGLSGEPVIIPDSIYLYGSSTSLSKVEMISAKEQSINNINKSGNYRIELEPIWEKYPDLHISNEQVELYIPVEQFVEKTISLPVVVTDISEKSQCNLYPALVSVQLLIPESQLDTFDPSDYLVTASIRETRDNHLTPQLVKFPSTVRIKSITPSRVQYVIFENN